MKKGAGKRKFEEESDIEDEIDDSDNDLNDDDHDDNDDDGEESFNSLDEDKNEVEKNHKKNKKDKNIEISKDKSGKKKLLKEKCNEKTSVFLKCRHFSKLSPQDVTKLFTDKNFQVKAIYKHPPMCAFGFVDVGSPEAVARAIKQFHTTKIQGQILIASKMNPKSVTQEEKIKHESSLPPITLVDRIMHIRNLPFTTSKRSLQDIFPKAETIIIPPSKGNALRDALAIFPSSGHLEKAFEQTFGCEFKGHKLTLEKIISTPYTGSAAINGTEKLKKADKLKKKVEKTPEKPKKSFGKLNKSR